MELRQEGNVICRVTREKMKKKGKKMKENYLKPKVEALLRILAPTGIFLFFYYVFGLKVAIISSCVFSGTFYVRDIMKEKRISNSSVIGGIGLIFQVVSAFFIGYEKLYYLPALIQNCVVLFFVTYLCFHSKSVFLYLVKDFHWSIFEGISDEDLLNLNYLWVAYCLLKVGSKIMGIIKLDFVSLYWLVFLLGTPLNVLLTAISYLIVKKKIIAKSSGVMSSEK